MKQAGALSFKMGDSDTWFDMNTSSENVQPKSDTPQQSARGNYLTASELFARDGKLSSASLQNAVGIQPRLAVMTLSQSFHILMSNSKVWDLFGYDPSELIGAQFEKLLADSTLVQQSIFISTSIHQVSAAVLHAGSMVDFRTSTGGTFPANLYVHKLAVDDDRWVAVVEELPCIRARLDVNSEGIIVAHDQVALELFGLSRIRDDVQTSKTLTGVRFNSVLPSASDVKGRGADYPHDGWDAIDAGVMQGHIARLSSGTMIPVLTLFENNADTTVVHVVHLPCFQSTITLSLDHNITSVPDSFSRFCFNQGHRELLSKPVIHYLPNLKEMIVTDITNSSSSVNIPARVREAENNDTADVRSINTTPTNFYNPDRRTMTRSKWRDNISDVNLLNFNSLSMDTLSTPSTPAPSTPAPLTPAPSTPALTRSPSKIITITTPSTAQEAKTPEPLSSAPLFTSESILDTYGRYQNIDEPGKSSLRSSSANPSQHKPPVKRTTSEVTESPDPPVISRLLSQRPSVNIERMTSKGDAPVPLLRRGRSLLSLSPEQATSSQTTMRKSSKQSALQSTEISITCRRFHLRSALSRESLGWVISVEYVAPNEILSLNKACFSRLNWTRQSRCTAARRETLDKTPISNQTTAQSQADILNAFHRGALQYRYQLLSSLGSGPDTFVYLTKRIEKNDLVVLKALDSNSRKREMRDGHPMEIIALQQLQHDHICCAIEIFAVDLNYFIIMDLHGNGRDLFSFIEESPNLSEGEVQFIFRQITSAVDYMHSQGICHRDIKDENIVIDERKTIQLIDFGSAAFLYEPDGQETLFTVFCGTLQFAAPEVLLGKPYRGKAYDIWSMGVLMYILLYAENPFNEADDAIETHLSPPFAPSQSFLDLLLRMLTPGPENRAVMSEIIEHPWLKNDIK